MRNEFSSYYAVTDEKFNQKEFNQKVEKKKINSQQMELRLDTYFTLVTNIQNHLIAHSIIKMGKKAL